MNVKAEGRRRRQFFYIIFCGREMKGKKPRYEHAGKSLQRKLPLIAVDAGRYSHDDDDDDETTDVFCLSLFAVVEGRKKSVITKCGKARTKKSSCAD
jgi:hypothetical protein